MKVQWQCGRRLLGDCKYVEQVSLRFVEKVIFDFNNLKKVEELIKQISEEKIPGRVSGQCKSPKN